VRSASRAACTRILPAPPSPRGQISPPGRLPHHRAAATRASRQPAAPRQILRAARPPGEKAKFEDWLKKYVALIFNSLVYVCTDQPDIETYRPGLNKAGKVKRSGRRQQQRPRVDDINEVVRFGFRMGLALNEARQRWERERSQTGTPTGIRQRSRRRRSHLPDLLDWPRSHGAQAQVGSPVLGEFGLARTRRTADCGGPPGQEAAVVSCEGGMAGHLTSGCFAVPPRGSLLGQLSACFFSYDG